MQFFYCYFFLTIKVDVSSYFSKPVSYNEITIILLEIVNIYIIITMVKVMPKHVYL